MSPPASEMRLGGMGISRRDLVSGAAGLALTSAIPARAFAAPADPEVARALSLVDPELRAMATQLTAMPFPPLSDATIAALRQSAAQWIKPPRVDIPIQDRKIAGAKGAPDIRIFVVNAKPGTSRPAILHTHGGGFVSGDPHLDLPNLQLIAQTLDCAIVTVDYRLAPETRFTGSIEDNYAGLKWLHANAAELGADRRKIAVMGESAGGGHAALLAITARDRGEVPVMFQCLIYPMLDDRTGSTRDVAPPVGVLMWTEPSNRYGWRSFLGVEPGGPRVPRAAVPARVASVAGLSPAFIGVGSLDLFVDEDIAYATRLVDAGISAELRVVPGAFHGFDIVVEGAKISKDFTAAKIDALRRAFAHV